MFSYTETSLQKLMVSLICKLEVGSDNKEQWSGHRQVLRKLKPWFNEVSCVAFLQCFHSTENLFFVHRLLMTKFCGFSSHFVLESY